MPYNLDYVSVEMQNILAPAICNRHEVQKALHFRELNDSYIAPFFKWRVSIGGVADNNKIAIVDSRNAEWEENFSPYCSDIPVIEHKTVIYLGVLLSGFGHCFTDDLRKLWFLETEECKLLLHEGAEIVYTTDLNQKLPSYARTILKYAKFDLSSARHITTLTQFSRIIIPDNSFYAEEWGRCYTSEYKQCVNNIICSLNEIPCSITVPEKVYLSRSKYSRRPESRSEVGEHSIERQMNKLGYVSIIPEDYSFEEQVFIAQNCKSMATTEGSIAHIALFCKPSCNLTIFCKARYLNYHQVAINEFSGVNVTYVEAHHSLKMSREIPWYGPFYLCVTKYFEKYLGYRILHFPFFIRISFWRYMRIIPRAINRMFHLFRIEKRF